MSIPRADCRDRVVIRHTEAAILGPWRSRGTSAPIYGADVPLDSSIELIADLGDAAARRRRPRSSSSRSASGNARSTTASRAGVCTDPRGACSPSAIRSDPRPVRGWRRSLPAGEGAVLSHRSAAALWGVRTVRRTGAGDVSRSHAPSPGHRHPPGRAAARRGDHRARHPGHHARAHALRPRRVLTRQQLEAAITEAEVRRLTSPTSLADLVARYPGRRGIATLRRILEDTGRIGRTLTRSELEIAFLALVDAHGLPTPDLNRTGDHGELDATLARRPPRRRARRLRDPRHPPRLRGRPRPGPRPPARRLARRPPHGPPAHGRGRHDRATAPDPPGGYRAVTVAWTGSEPERTPPACPKP